MQEHPYGWISLLPPLVAIVLAMVTRRAVTSLLTGIFCGALITNGGNVLGATIDFAEVHLWPTLADPGKLRVFAFTILMGAMIGVISRSGGMLGLIELVKPIARSRRSGQLTAWLLGMFVFFDDYANTILLGGTLRPLFDRLKISREKLAYIVDSTAAPIASLAVLSTWVAIEIDYIYEGLEAVEGADPTRAMELFIASVPFRFYAILALLMVPIVALTGRDFGAMRRAEAACLAEEDAKAESQEPAHQATRPQRAAPWWVAAAPILVTLLVVMALLYATGQASLRAGVSLSGDAAPTFPLRDILGAADSSLALQYGSLVGLATITVISLALKLLTLADIQNAGFGGIRMVLPAIVILWTASALSRQTGSKSVDGTTSEQYEYRDYRLYTGQFVAGKIFAQASAGGEQASAGGEQASDPDSIPVVVRLLPTIVFLLAAVLSFSTGTSFGTMGLLMPMSITLAVPLLSAATGDGSTSAEILLHPLMLATIASVLSGAVFGDHCSPISDTTILSSQACGSDHIAHVLTQMPYSVCAALIAVLLGTIPLGWGVGWGWLLLIQLIAVVAVVWWVGKPLEPSAADAQAR